MERTAAILPVRLAVSVLSDTLLSQRFSVFEELSAFADPLPQTVLLRYFSDWLLPSLGLSRTFRFGQLEHSTARANTQRSGTVVQVLRLHKWNLTCSSVLSLRLVA